MITHIYRVIEILCYVDIENYCIEKVGVFVTHNFDHTVYIYAYIIIIIIVIMIAYTPVLWHGNIRPRIMFIRKLAKGKKKSHYIYSV